MRACLTEHPAGTLLSLYVQPRSSKNQVVGLHGDCLKLKLTSPPVGGAANKCCCDYLAKLLRLAKSDVVLVGGDKARQKRVLLRGVELREVEEILRREAGQS